jgi:hypothetical protein
MTARLPVGSHPVPAIRILSFFSSSGVSFGGSTAMVSLSILPVKAKGI